MNAAVDSPVGDVVALDQEITQIDQEIESLMSRRVELCRTRHSLQARGPVKIHEDTHVSSRKAAWKVRVLEFLHGDPQPLQAIVNHCITQIREGKLTTSVHPADRSAVARNISQTLTTAKKDEEVTQGQDRRWTLTEEGRMWLLEKKMA